jgi:hypothetical protein
MHTNMSPSSSRFSYRVAQHNTNNHGTKAITHSTHHHGGTCIEASYFVAYVINHGEKSSLYHDRKRGEREVLQVGGHRGGLNRSRQAPPPGRPCHGRHHLVHPRRCPDTHLQQLRRVASIRCDYLVEYFVAQVVIREAKQQYNLFSRETH